MPTIINGDGVVTAGGTASTQGKVVLAEQTGSGTNTVTIQAPATLAADLTFTMPTADGTNGQVLQTNGSGALSFVNQTSPTSLATPLTVIGDATAGAEIRLPEDTDNGSNYVALKAPDNLASNLTLTLPTADGTSGQVLQTNGSGQLSFATPASALELVASITPTAVSVLTIDNVFTTAYENYYIFGQNICVNTENAYSLMQFIDRSTGTAITSGYYGQTDWAPNNLSAGGSSTQGPLRGAMSSNTSWPNGFDMILYNASLGVGYWSKQIGYLPSPTNAGQTNLSSGGLASTGTAIRGFRLTLNSGSFRAQGKIMVFGIKG